jgi:hypothetical protein
MRHRIRRRSFHSVVVALCLMALLVTTGVQAAPLAPAQLPEVEALANPAIRFDPSSSTVPPGATFAVNVAVDNAADLGGFQFTMTFDPAVVKVQNVALGSFLGSTGRTVGAVGPVTPTVGTCKFGGFSYGAAAGPNGTGTVVSLTLQAVAVGSSNLTFTAAQLTNTQWDPLTVVTPTVVSGAVTVWVATLGDVNADGAGNSTDALIILSADVGMNTTYFCPMNCGDVNQDGYVDSTDALIILSYDVGMTVPFPIGQLGCPSSVTQPAGCNP